MEAGIVKAARGLVQPRSRGVGEMLVQINSARRDDATRTETEAKNHNTQEIEEGEGAEGERHGRIETRFWCRGEDDDGCKHSEAMRRLLVVGIAALVSPTAVAWGTATRHSCAANNVPWTQTPALPRAASLNQRLKSRERTCLWQVPNGGGGGGELFDVAEDTRGFKEEEKMTLEKAGALATTFWRMASPYYQESQPGRRLFYGMLLLTLLNSGVSVAFSYISKDFWNALSSKDSAEFYSMMIKFGSALVVGAPVAVLYRYQREQLAVHWREWMTDRVLQLWNNNRVYYSLERDTSGSGEPEGGPSLVADASNEVNGENSQATAAARIDNPDQRITEDVRTFTAFSLQLFITIATSLIDLVSFSLILYSIQPQLFATIILYALFGTVTTTYIGSSLLPLNFEKLRREADLRYLLVRIREK